MDLARRPLVCVVTDGSRWRLQGRAVVEARLLALVRAAVAAQVALVHVRERDMEAGALYDLVAALAELSKGSRTTLVVNDRVDVALAANAAGVHLRELSAPSERVRAMVPAGFVVGRSVHSVEQARRAATEGVDYVCFGTVFPSRSKPRGAVAAGVGELRAVTEGCGVPVLAIGGISLDRIAEVADAGAAGFAAIELFSGGDERDHSEPARRIERALDVAGRCAWR